MPSGQSSPHWNRIFGGQEAEVGQFPYQISLRTFVSANEYEHFCSGSILSSHFVVTAAHCVLHPRKIFVVVGAHSKDLLVNQNDLYTVMRKIIHEQNDPRYLYNDIALLKLDNEIKLRNNVQIIAVNPKYVDEGYDATVSGWGQSNACE